MSETCKEEDDDPDSDGPSEKPEAEASRHLQRSPEDCCQDEQNGSPMVKSTTPKLPPPGSLGLPPLTDHLSEVKVKPTYASCVAKLRACTDNWVHAMEFVPGKPYCARYSYACGRANQQGHPTEKKWGRHSVEDEARKLGLGERPHKVGPTSVREDPPDLSGLTISNTEQTAPKLVRRIKSRFNSHLKDGGRVSAVQRSRHLACGICREVIYEKANPNEVRFGILSNCNHTFCLKCIRKWRSAKQFESKIIKACPECRVTSNFVIPSEIWVEERNEKLRLIQKYKEAMSNKPCRYFDGGRGSCPFGSNCFYKHAYSERTRARAHKFSKAI
ncbi:E3 ubiquitin-protein ligase makorin-1-like [Antechinus flavipes]|uniref:E3 ubiquitin-protein ligase makorin-1-like n=1 Tax=Antechinus flavipes TaxID=38775 RepID=UPI0022361D5A|nr:E3 ubiquitin-protein ligase makorin-1-like [Antechinus flavipes]